MDNAYLKLEWTPELDRPILIAGFTGWNDAAEAASTAVNTLAESWEAKQFGAFDAEEFLDYQATRPHVRLTEDVTRYVEWPENELLVTGQNPPGGNRGTILLRGPEPNFRWRSFCGAIVELAKELGVETVVTMGALLADVPHSRPVAVSANSPDAALIESLELTSSRYEGPTGITGVLHGVCAEAGLSAISFWASVPHYLPSVPSAPAALALLEGLSGVMDMDVDTTGLEKTAEEYREQVSAAVSQDSNLASYVQMLEERYDSQSEEEGPRDLPTGEDLAQELESFLRERPDDE